MLPIDEFSFQGIFQFVSSEQLLAFTFSELEEGCFQNMNETVFRK